MDQSIGLSNDMSLSHPSVDLSNDKSLSHPTQNTLKLNKTCMKCKKRRKLVNGIVCQRCYKIGIVLQSGNKVIDDFIKSMLNNCNVKAKLEFVPYDRFEGIEFIAEGGFSKVYKATWINGPMTNKWNERKQEYDCYGRMTVALKELKNSKNIDSKELNELRIFYNSIAKKRSENRYINQYFGITQNPITQNFMIITKFYKSGNLADYITRDFFNISWEVKLYKLWDMTWGLKYLHGENIIHQDYHSGNILIAVTDDKRNVYAATGDLGLSKSATESLNDDNEVYGNIPYVAPEIFQGQKYTKASDIYGFGMIMWELMTGRRPFWDESHDTYLIIKILDGHRPPIVTNAPEGYIELMQKCWHSDPNERPSASDIWSYFAPSGKLHYENERKNPTKIIKSPDIGPITTNNPGAIYKSRSLSIMIKSAESTRSLRSQGIVSKFDKRKFNDNLFNDENNKKFKLFENENDAELGLDIENNDINLSRPSNNDYITEEINFDIDIPVS